MNLQKFNFVNFKLWNFHDCIFKMIKTVIPEIPDDDDTHSFKLNDFLEFSKGDSNLETVCQVHLNERIYFL